MKTAVIGGTGFIGEKLIARIREQYPDSVATIRGSADDGLYSLDLSAPRIDHLNLRKSDHQAVVIAAGVTSIDDCERAPEETFQVNVSGTLELIRLLDTEGMHVVFFSSDRVFDGASGGYSDDSAPSPNTEYGRHKLLVEQAIPRICSHYLILRLSKLYGTQKGDGTLLDAMAAEFQRGRVVRAAHDDVFSPTHVADLIDTLVYLLAHGVEGTMNCCAPEAWSRYDLAMALARAVGVEENQVSRISMNELDLDSARPRDTSMICNRMKTLDLRPFRSARMAIEEIACNWTPGFAEAEEVEREEPMHD